MYICIHIYVYIYIYIYIYIWDLLTSAIIVRYVRYILGMGAF